MAVCTVCGGTQFEGDGGHYYCIECSTQTQEIREEVQAEPETVNIQATVIHTTKSTKTKKGPKFGDNWTTHEAYNVIISQQVKSLIRMGASPKLKDVVLQLWAFYLRKNEVAFKQDDENWEPRLGAFPRKRDVQILSGETEIFYRKNISKKQKKAKKKGKVKTEEKNENGKLEDAADTVEDSNAMLVDNDVEGLTGNQAETGDKGREVPEDSNGTTLTYKKKKTSELEHSRVAKKLQRKTGKNNLKAMPPHVRETYSEFMSLPKTLCFCYLGLLLLSEDILLCDIIRFAMEGHFPYMDATHHLPESMELQDSDWTLFTPGAPPNLKKIVSLSTQLAMFLKIPKFPSRPLLPIAVRFIKDLGLPDDLITVVKNLLQKRRSPAPWIPPLKKQRFSKATIPLYEVEAMAYVLVAAKLVFGLDGKAERKLSKFANKKNTKDSNLNYFVWDEWLANTKLKEMFLRSRNIPHSYFHENSLDVELIHSNYFDVLKSWTHRTSVTKKNHRYNQPQFRKEMKKVFSETFTKSSDTNRLVCSASSFPLLSRLCQQVNRLNNCHQYSLSEADSRSLLKNFSACSLSYIFRHWNHKSKTKSKRKSRLLGQDISTGYNLNSCEKPDSNCTMDDAPEGVAISSTNEFAVGSTETKTSPPKKRKRDSDSCTKTSKKRKKDKHSEVKIHKKKSSKKKRNRADCDSESPENRKISAVEEGTETRKENPKSSKNSMKSKKNKKLKKSRTSKSKSRVKKKKKKEKGNKSKKGSRKKSQIFSKNYWYVNCPFSKIQQACDKLPETFKWLLQFTSAMIETSNDVLYSEVLIIERRLFKGKLKSK